ncbi:MAG: archaemetzincin family Zn-dependent metalloprotease [Polyangiales bacterium]
MIASAASVELPAPPPAPRHLDVHLVPLGDVSADTLADTADALRAHAPVDVVIESRRPLPASASVGASRFRAEKLLEFLASLPLSLQTGGAKVMGVAAVDIVTTKGGNPTWGILGLGAIDGRCSVLSTFRIERAWEKGGGAPAALVHARLWKVSLHELGHTLGLPHCPRARCIMEDAHGTVQTVDGEDALCPECAARFEAAIASGAALGAPDRGLPPD